MPGMRVRAARVSPGRLLHRGLRLRLLPVHARANALQGRPMSKPEDFTPTVLAPGYGIVMVATETCAACMRTMIRTGSGADFPAFWRAGRKAQMERAGWGERAYVTDANDKPLCKNCAPKAGAFRCALCKQDRHGDAEESYGDPAEHLCTPCYETVPAKVWFEKDRELQTAHRYDFE